MQVQFNCAIVDCMIVLIVLVCDHDKYCYILINIISRIAFEEEQTLSLYAPAGELVIAR
jgi:hypothetical protein